MQMHMSAAARPIAPSYSGRGHATAGPLGWLAAVAAAAGLVWLVFGKALSSWAARFGPGGRTGGKWVSDRSLGGRMVSHVSELSKAMCDCPRPCGIVVICILI